MNRRVTILNPNLWSKDSESTPDTNDTKADIIKKIFSILLFIFQILMLIAVS
jgi:hypothetical protein